jgi:hypothetical protein
MTLEQFRMTRRSVECIGSIIRDSSLTEIPGWVYAGHLFIERMADGSPSLRIANTEQSGPIETLESILHEWAVSEEIFTA